MGCYQFTGSLSAVSWCAYMMDWLPGFSCDVGERCVDYEKAEVDGEGETGAASV